MTHVVEHHGREGTRPRRSGSPLYFGPPGCFEDCRHPTHEVVEHHDSRREGTREEARRAIAHCASPTSGIRFFSGTEIVFSATPRIDSDRRRIRPGCGGHSRDRDLRAAPHDCSLRKLSRPGQCRRRISSCPTPRCGAGSARRGCLRCRRLCPLFPRFQAPTTSDGRERPDAMADRVLRRGYGRPEEAVLFKLRAGWPCDPPHPGSSTCCNPAKRTRGPARFAPFRSGRCVLRTWPTPGSGRELCAPPTASEVLWGSLGYFAPAT